MVQPVYREILQYLMTFQCKELSISFSSNHVLFLKLQMFQYVATVGWQTFFCVCMCFFRVSSQENGKQSNSNEPAEEMANYFVFARILSNSLKKHIPLQPLFASFFWKVKSFWKSFFMKSLISDCLNICCYKYLAVPLLKCLTDTFSTEMPENIEIATKVRVLLCWDCQHQTEIA